MGFPLGLHDGCVEGRGDGSADEGSKLGAHEGFEEVGCAEGAKDGAAVFATGESDTSLGTGVDCGEGSALGKHEGVKLDAAVGRQEVGKRDGSILGKKLGGAAKGLGGNVGFVLGGNVGSGKGLLEGGGTNSEGAALEGAKERGAEGTKDSCLLGFGKVGNMERGATVCNIEGEHQ